MNNVLIKFLRKKDYTYIRDIGQGGTGQTILIEDETIGEMFVCKKYAPYYEEYQQAYYQNFVDEIKLLHILYHKNIVRVFNYYLYPERTTGYILMEFVDGMSIGNYIKENPERLNDLFAQTISGFSHLEENDILHRDIRPENIMVSNFGTVKIIDFGFGKKIRFDEGHYNSVSLNWRYAIPKDFELKVYDFKTEIYFVGKLFEEIIKDNNIQNFSFTALLNEMTCFDSEYRISSFFVIDRKIIEGNSAGITFTDYEKEVYRRFAYQVAKVFTKIENTAEYVRDIDTITAQLEEAHRNSMLEDSIQNPATICRCFVRGNFSYLGQPDLIFAETVKEFVQMLKKSGVDKKRIIINNLWQRLDTVKRFVKPPIDDLPF